MKPYLKQYPLFVFLSSSALVLSSATQLRIGPIGPGEILIIAMYFTCLVKIIYNRYVKINIFVLSYFTIVLNCLFICLIPLFFAVLNYTFSDYWARQYVFILLSLTFPLLVYWSFGSRMIEDIMFYYSKYVIILFAFFLIITISITSVLGGVNLLYGIRYRGLALNPNQAALAIGVAVPIMLHYFMNSKLQGRGNLLVIILGLLVGIAIGSNALQVAWALGLALSITQSKTIGEGLWLGRVQLSTLFSAAIALLAIMTILLGLFWFINNFQTLYEGSGTGMAPGQGAVRVSLWMAAFEAFLDAPLLGHGPGHFSGLTGPYQGSEAHSLYFDWMASYGIIGSVILFGYMIAVGIRLFLMRRWSILSVFLIITIISALHFFARHPVFWFSLFYCGLCASQKLTRTNAPNTDWPGPESSQPTREYEPHKKTSSAA